MPEQQFAIFEIQTYLLSWRQMETRAFGAVKASIRALVRCTGVGQDGAAYTMDVYFLAPDSPFPAPIIELEGRLFGALFFPIADLLPFVDMLRNEKPIYGHLRADHPQWTSVTTSNEPVGEGEGP
jgi:hypothetical protein